MIDRFEYSPWDFWSSADAAAQSAQLVAQRELAAAHPGWSFGRQCFVSSLASVDNDRLLLGDRSYVAAGAYLSGTLEIGRDCSVNPYTVIRGDVRIGDAVRIGAHTSILGFNHTMTDTTVEFFRQPLTSRGIRIGDDVWVGSHVVVLDGVTVGDQSVLAAGAVVTKDVPAGAIVGGNPARFLRWRVPPVAESAEPPTGLAARVAAFGDRARSQATALLERSFDAQTGLFSDRPGEAPTVRAQCDAIEIADLLLGTAPPQLPSAEQAARLRGWQDPATGAVAPLGSDGRQTAAAGFEHPDAAYHVLCVGYALGLLGETLDAPLTLATSSSAAQVAASVDALPWGSDAWGAGHRVDALGTAMHFSRLRGDTLPEGAVEALVGWLLTRADPQTGMWGRADPHDALLLVNGFYRASRGTFAQFGLPLPYPERVVDTVLRHAGDARYFATGRRNACNVLDVAHPLWLARASGHRGDEATALARRLLDDALEQWADEAGFAFLAADESTAGLPGSAPGLQGTEMWLAIVWYLADLAGLADALGYRPRGIHRPEPAPANSKTTGV